MSEDMDKKIQQIAELFGQEKMPDNVKGLLSLLAGSLGNKGESAAPPPEAEGQPREEEPAAAAADNTDNNEDVLRKAKSIANSLNGSNDPRINLLYAIRPFMNSNRQKKISNCIQLLQMSSLARLMDKQEK